MKPLLLILAVAGVTDLPGCYVCTPAKIGSIVKFSDVTWPPEVSLPVEWQPYAMAICGKDGWTTTAGTLNDPMTYTPAPPYVWPIGETPILLDPFRLPPPPPLIWPPTNVPPKPAAP